MNDISDYIIIGSGFGGSVSALRLSEKGYQVKVLEAGRRYEDKDFPHSNREISKWLFWPKLGLHGIMRMNFFRDAFFLSGAGVGGGSLVYANTLLVPPDPFFRDPQWSQIADWKERLTPFYKLAQRMLGVTENTFEGEPDLILKEISEEMGRGNTYHRAHVGVFLGEPGKTVSDPFFGGAGPDRTGCHFCGACMVGCRHGAKNSLMKNYLYLAEHLGAEIIPETRVTAVIPNEDGTYTVQALQGSGFFRKGRAVRFKTHGVIFSAGVLGTVDLLLKMKMENILPLLSETLGDRLRTNSEALVGVQSHQNVNFSKGLAITSGFYPEENTHVEVTRYPEKSDMIGLLATPMVGGGPTPVRILKWIWQVFRHPINTFRGLWIKNWAKKSIILLVMQNLDNHLKLALKRPWYWPFKKRMTTVVKPDQRVPTYLPIANRVAEIFARKIGGQARSCVTEVFLNKSSTAHILGGAVIGADSKSGVINERNEVFGYKNLYVIDGSMIPANLGVNPSLTITAMAEHAMSTIPVKDGAVFHPGYPGSSEKMG